MFQTVSGLKPGSRYLFDVYATTIGTGRASSDDNEEFLPYNQLKASTPEYC
jgi:hypothetical protein